MKMTREILIDRFPGVYATGGVELKGRQYMAFASENRGGRLYLVDALTRTVKQVKDCNGGVMAVIDAKEENAFFCIEEFYPVFDSATAKLTRYTAVSENGQMKTNREVVAKIPYIHRVAQIQEDGKSYIAAGRLCRHKEYVEDWSTSGCMEIAKYDPENFQSIHFEVVCDRIFKHHALWVKSANGNDELYYGGTEGVFRSVWKAGSWQTEQIVSVPASDIVVEDLDGDGVEELAIIEGFHGNQCTVFKFMDGSWKRALEIPMDFGHVLWGGSFLGEPALILGSRAGEKKLVMMRFETDAGNAVRIREEIVIDTGQAPAQIYVMGEETGKRLIAANHGAAQAVLYRFE